MVDFIDAESFSADHPMCASPCPSFIARRFGKKISVPTSNSYFSRTGI